MKATKNAPHINKSQENTPNWKHSWKLKVISFQFSHSLLLECYFSRRYRFITNAYNCYLYCTQWRVGSWNKLWVSDLRFGHIFVESYLLIWLHVWHEFHSKGKGSMPPIHGKTDPCLQICFEATMFAPSRRSCWSPGELREFTSCCIQKRGEGEKIVPFPCLHQDQVSWMTFLEIYV